ncbi:TrmB family transcriptional regulator [Methanobacterium oryzae]|uniref:TrmB family transcriptional regulator n=1 Tax=Methanobacterium oryzae TaxID=69540 RepID=UPI003D19DFBD
MMFDEKMISALQKLSLTNYGAKTYIVITNFGPIDAAKIAEEASIPRTKIYAVLTKLEEGGWINVEHGRPKLFTARDPRGIIDERRSDLLTEIDSLSDEMSMMYDQQIKKEIPKVWLIQGNNNITAKSFDMVSKANKSIMMLGDLYFPEEVESLKSLVLKAKRNNISFRIIANDVIKTSKGEIDLVKAFTDVQPDMIISGKPPIKYVIVDEKELLIMFPKINEDILDLNKVIALWIPSPAVASSMVDMFNMRWNEYVRMQINNNQ